MSNIATTATFFEFFIFYFFVTEDVQRQLLTIRASFILSDFRKEDKLVKMLGNNGYHVCSL